MKQLSLLFSGIFFSVLSFSQDVKITMSDNNKNAKAIIRANKILREEVYSYNFTKSRIIDSFLVKIIYYDTAGNPMAKMEDPHLQKISKNNPVAGAITKYSYLYDSTGKLRKYSSDNPGLNELLNTEYSYDSAGNMENKYVYNEDTSMLNIEHRVYDTKNRVVQLFTKVNNGALYNSAQYDYNGSGQLSKETILDDKGKVIYSRLYEYSLPPGRKSVSIVTKEGTRLESEIFYDSSERPTRENGVPNEGITPGGDPSDYERFLSVYEYRYNNDGTFFQWTIYSIGKKAQLNRHYYFTKFSD